jgi:hypothetical protein
MQGACHALSEASSTSCANAPDTESTATDTKAKSDFFIPVRIQPLTAASNIFDNSYYDKIKDAR